MYNIILRVGDCIILYYYSLFWSKRRSLSVDLPEGHITTMLQRNERGGGRSLHIEIVFTRNSDDRVLKTAFTLFCLKLIR